MHRYPVGLAVIARHHTEARVGGARKGYRTIRAELSAWLSSDEIDAVLRVYGTSGKRQVAAARAVALVEEALRQEGFRPLP